AELRARCKAEGMWGPQIPKELGGLGLALVEHALVSERLGRSPLGHYVFGCQAPDAGNLEILHKYGTPPQKARWLEPLARGEIRLGAEGAGFLIAQERLGPGRIHHCMRWIGICERVFDTMCARVATRKIDADKTLATRQIAQAWVAEARADIDASRLMVLHAA